MINQTLNNRYTITASVGEGAMGEVYQGTDTQTGQTVAVKVITQKLAVDAEIVERFRREGEALRQLRHANIVGFVDMFLHGKQHVIVMEYVPGGSLHKLIARGPLPVDQAVRIALELCDALTRAHHLTIIHRDIKPENVLMAEDGTPKLTDFGLARLVSETARLTGTGTQMGTPYYMAPEAWEGKPLDAQADIWALGVVLYEMLTGRVPFAGETLVAVMNKVLSATPPDVKALRPDVPPALMRVVQRMLTRDKTQRYQTIREVALDLERVARGEEVATAVEPRGKAQRSSRPAKFLLAAVLAAVALLVVCGLAAGGAWILGRQLLPASPTAAASTPGPASQAGKTPTPAVGLTAAVQPPTKISPALQATFTSPPPTRTSALPPSLTAVPPKPSAVVALPVPINTLLPQSPRAITTANAGAVTQLASIQTAGGGKVAWSPDGKVLAAAASDGLELYDSQTFKLVRTVGDRQWLDSFAFMPDGQSVAVTGSAGVTIWRVDTGGQAKVFQSLKDVKELAVSPDGKVLAAGIGQVVKLIDFASGAEMATLPIGSSDCNLDFSPDGKWLVTGGGVAGQDVVVYDVASGNQVYALEGHSNWMRQVLFSADGHWLITANVDQTAKLWDLTTGLLRTSFVGHTGQLGGAALSPDGTVAATNSWDLTVKLWDAATGQILNTLTGPTEWAKGIAFSPDGALVASSDFGSTVRVWGLPPEGSSAATSTPWAMGPIPTALPLSAKAISPENVGQLKQLAAADGIMTDHIVFAPDGQRVAASTSGLSFFDPLTLKKLSSLSSSSGSFAFAPDGKRVVVGTYDGIVVYQVAGGASQPFAGSQNASSVTFSPDGSLVASVSGQSVKIWEAASGKELRTLPAGPSQGNVAFSPEGRRLVAAGGVAGQEISIWDTGSWQVIYTLKGHENWISRLVFSPDGQTLASSASDHSIRFWDLTTGLLARTIPIPEDRSNQVPALAFSPDGRLLVSSYGVPLISIWEVASGNELRTLTGPTSMTRALAFSPDGAYLVTGDDALRLWGVAP